jgi:hypothetical protein
MRLREHAARVHDGSGVLVRTWAGWIGCGERGPAAARAAGSATVAWLSWGMVQGAPGIMWPATAGWCVAAWRAGAVSGETPPTPCSEHRAALLVWLEEVTRGRSGIHLHELYARLRRRPALAHLTDPELRACLDHYAIPVRRSIRVDGVAGRTGVHRADIEALLASPSPVESGPLSGDGEPGQGPDSPPLSTVGEGVERTCDAA